MMAEMINYKFVLTIHSQVLRKQFQRIEADKNS